MHRGNYIYQQQLKNKAEETNDEKLKQRVRQLIDQVSHLKRENLLKDLQIEKLKKALK